MARELMIEEFHITVMVPWEMKEAACMTLHRTLNNKRFHKELHRAVREVFTRHTSLRQARILLGR